jgi:hypothetical protein
VSGGRANRGWHARGQGFKSPILHCGKAAIEQESGRRVGQVKRQEPWSRPVAGSRRSPALYGSTDPLIKCRLGRESASTVVSRPEAPRLARLRSSFQSRVLDRCFEAMAQLNVELLRRMVPRSIVESILTQRSHPKEPDMALTIERSSRTGYSSP